MVEHHSSDVVEYRDVPGFPGYRVGDDGSIWSIIKRGDHGLGRAYDTHWRKLRPLLHRRWGYYTIRLVDEKRKKRSFWFHRIVLIAFHGPQPEGMESRHLNSIRTDNRPCNLAWGTREENYQDIRDAGNHVKGERQWNSRLTEEQICEIRTRYAAGGTTYPELAAEFGVHVKHIAKIVRGKAWSHVTTLANR